MEERRLRFVPPENVPLTPAQRATAWFFFAVAALLLAQTLLGGATAHYHADDGSFFGLDLAQILPYNLARTWHLQLALFVVSAAFLAGGIFLAPLVAGREPRGQGILSYLLLGALVVVVVGSLLGEAASYHGLLHGPDRPLFGAQGWEYLDLGRFWQVLLIIGMLLCRLVLALVLLDGWMYLWHRANHTIPFLWRFHRMHHSETEMDVTTATRFHLGEHISASLLRAGLIPLLGFEVWQLIVYDTLLIVISMLHHANISLGQYDRWLRWLIVTPDMHKVHHSSWRPETDSNYSTVFSAWDRLAQTFRMRPDPKTLLFGLPEFRDAGWQTVWGMLRTPFATPSSEPREDLLQGSADPSPGVSVVSSEEAVPR
jgi:sterol desaturase/sphingolipid hydroxylase (fatty acid hydroxylase superfamily)